jgi:hypothetical protein
MLSADLARGGWLGHAKPPDPEGRDALETGDGGPGHPTAPLATSHAGSVASGSRFIQCGAVSPCSHFTASIASSSPGLVNLLSVREAW